MLLAVARTSRGLRSYICMGHLTSTSTQLSSARTLSSGLLALAAERKKQLSYAYVWDGPSERFKWRIWGGWLHKEQALEFSPA